MLAATRDFFLRNSIEASPLLAGHDRLPREERQSHQKTDQIPTAVAEAVRVVRFHARRQPAVGERNLETEAKSQVPIAGASLSCHTIPVYTDKRPPIESIPDPVPSGLVDDSELDVVGGCRRAAEMNRVEIEARLDGEVVGHEESDSEVLNRETDDCCPRGIESEDDSAIYSELYRS